LRELEHRNRILENNQRSRCPGRSCLAGPNVQPPTAASELKHKQKLEQSRSVDWMYKTANRKVGEAFEDVKRIADSRTKHCGRPTSFTKARSCDLIGGSHQLRDLLLQSALILGKVTDALSQLLCCHGIFVVHPPKLCLTERNLLNVKCSSSLC